MYGFNVGVSGLFLRGINHPPEERVISDIGENQTNIGEAYLNWRYGDFRITGGNQRLDLPFVGDYDWRITPDSLSGAGYAVRQRRRLPARDQNLAL